MWSIPSLLCCCLWEKENKKGRRTPSPSSLLNRLLSPLLDCGMVQLKCSPIELTALSRCVRFLFLSFSRLALVLCFLSNWPLYPATLNVTMCFCSLMVVRLCLCSFPFLSGHTGWTNWPFSGALLFIWFAGKQKSITASAISVLMVCECEYLTFLQILFNLNITYCQHSVSN